MPGELDGLQLAEEASKRRPDLEVIVTSGARRIRDEDLPDHGTFLPKPYRPTELAALVSAKLDDS
jgi:DNA-binding NtrC family response regulator